MSKYRRETVQLHWVTMRENIAYDTDSALTATTRKNSDLPAHAFVISPGMNLIDFMFKCNVSGATCTAKIYVTRKDGDIEDVCSVAVASGDMVSADNKYYADTLTPTNYWYKTVITSDASGNDRMAKLKFDALGRRMVFILLSSVTENQTWDIFISGE